MQITEREPKLKTIFNDCRIVALAGVKNSGKTNNLISLIKDYREFNKKIPIYAYGMPESVMCYLRSLGVKEISCLSHLIHKKGCILIIDEMQKLKLNDRRFKDDLAEFVDFVYHNNVYCILSSPNIREFNTIIGSVIEKWLLKDIKLNQCVNGSQLKKVVELYKGRHKSLGCITMPKDKLLVINDHEEIVIHCDYVRDADNKIFNKTLF